jgi:ribulose-5-phosphate 4-epimerase/fuculose-1-phosphate aldolase
VKEGDARSALVRTARMMHSAGLAESFGHVSVRHGDGFLITTVEPFLAQSPEGIIHVDDLSDPPSGGGRAPLETPMHAEVYKARADVSAICRGHPPSVVVWGTGIESLPLAHGLGAMAGVGVDVHPDVDLISTPSQGEQVARTLGDADSLILRANGCFSVGTSLLEALTRLYYLEERARVVLDSSNRFLDIDWGGRFRHTGPELNRAMAWFDARFGEET